MNKIIQILFAIILIVQLVFALTAKNAQQCFDVLDKLSKNEIKTIYFMNFKDIAHTHPATDILSCYLHEAHPGDKTTTEQYFDVYKKCDEFKRTNFEPFGYDELEELVLLGLPYNLEKYLRQKMESGNKKELEQGILHVQDVMSKDIELSRDYKDYKYYILMKYKPNIDQFSTDLKTIFEIIDGRFHYYLRNVLG